VRSLKRKLHSKRGASMILALALFLICTVVSSLIISAAASGASRSAQRIEQQQSYLAISSAADMFRQEMELGACYVGSAISVDYGCISDCVESAEIAYIIDGTYEMQSGKRLDSKYIWYPLDDAHLIIEKPHFTSDRKETDGVRTHFDSVILEGLLRRASESVYLDGEEYTETITIELEGEDRLPEVICIFKMDLNYNITMQFTTDSTQYAMLISVKADREEVPVTVVDKESDVHQVYYKHFQESDGTFVDKLGEVAIDVTTTTTVTTIMWDELTVEKGVLGDD